MIWLYRLLFPLLFLIGLPYYLGRMLKRGGYRENFGERFGRVEAPPPHNVGSTIWIQAVSVGEILAIEPVIRELQRNLPSCRILLTTTTSTGYKLARKTVKNVAGIHYFPLDFWPISRRVWNRFRPDLCLLMEGELWPEHLHQARRRKVPVLLVNARLSDRSFRRYQKAGRIGRLVFQSLQRIAAASEEDARRLAELTGTPEKITVSGNLKFDVDFPPRPEGDERVDALRHLGLCPPDAAPGLILLGSSTWPGEEEMLAEVYQRLRNSGAAVRLVIVPRHAERRQEVLAALRRAGLSATLRSEKGPCAPGDVYLADTTGELRHFTSLADLAFIGKSLPPNEGGQTPIEAAGFGIPMVYGPNMSNFKAACRGLEDKDAAIRAETADDASEALYQLALDADRRNTLSQNAISWHAENRGSVGRTVQIICEVLGEAQPKPPPAGESSV